MCEVYESEYRLIVQSEDRYTVHGFVSALQGKSRECPGPAFRGEAAAWYHGYGCATCEEPFLPWAVETTLGKTYAAREAIKKVFALKRQLPPEQMKQLISAGWILSYEGTPFVPDPRKPLEDESEPARAISFSD